MRLTQGPSVYKKQSRDPTSPVSWWEMQPVSWAGTSRRCLTAAGAAVSLPLLPLLAGPRHSLSPLLNLEKPLPASRSPQHPCACSCACACVLVAQSCLTLCDPMDCSPPGSSVHGILQARTLEWVVIAFSRGSS